MELNFSQSASNIKYKLLKNSSLFTGWLILSNRVTSQRFISHQIIFHKELIRWTLDDWLAKITTLLRTKHILDSGTTFSSPKPKQRVLPGRMVGVSGRKSGWSESSIYGQPASQNCVPSMVKLDGHLQRQFFEPSVQKFWLKKLCIAFVHYASYWESDTFNSLQMLRQLPSFMIKITIFIGPRYTWGPIYGSKCLSVTNCLLT